MGKPLALSLLVVLSLALLGCNSGDSQGAAPFGAYSVTAYDSATNTWTVVETDSKGKALVKYVLVCDFFQWGSHKAVKGPDACNLSVGEKIIPGISKKKFVQVYNLGGTHLSIMIGRGKDQVDQQFTIKSAQSLSAERGT